MFCNPKNVVYLHPQLITRGREPQIINHYASKNKITKTR